MEWIQIRDCDADTSKRLRETRKFVSGRPEMENQLTFKDKDAQDRMHALQKINIHFYIWRHIRNSGEQGNPLGLNDVVGNR